MPAACLAATACFFFRLALLALVCFCVDFFWFDFGDLSLMILTFFYGLTRLRHVSFSEGKTIMPAGAIIVNGGREIIWRVAAPRPRKRAIIAFGRQLLIDLWRWKTGRRTPEQLGWVMTEA